MVLTHSEMKLGQSRELGREFEGDGSGHAGGHEIGQLYQANAVLLSIRWLQFYPHSYGRQGVVLDLELEVVVEACSDDAVLEHFWVDGDHLVTLIGPCDSASLGFIQRKKAGESFC